MRLLPLFLAPLLVLTSCATLQSRLSPAECALRLQQSQTVEEALKVLSAGGLAPSAVTVLIQAIVDGRTTLEVACQIANDPTAVARINSNPDVQTPEPAPTPPAVPSI